MAGDITTATGARIFVGPSTLAATDTVAEFAALTYTEIGLVESLGEFGDQSSAVNFASLGDGRQRKAKGVRDAGDLTITCAHDVTDAGQVAMVAAEATNLKYAFKVVLPDEQTEGGAGTTLYFRGLVMSKRLNVGSADNVIRQTFNVGIDSAIAEAPAT
ncbi:iron ABC transporter substrate-binding protein [Methylobacterium radiotolerans]|nr:iron ABC transporter substrate-binding protein [Methylobacterium radiotolerans]